MIRQQLENFMAKKRSTLLGVGPMSVNCVNAALEIANDYDVFIMLIASRRQIDSEEFNGGYVNNWTTQQFAQYIIDRDKKGKILLARDHGGPWQSDLEKNNLLSLRNAMESAKISYKADIDAGFQILHIDPSVDIHGTPSTDEILDRIFELYEYCWSYSQSKSKDIIFEIGTEEQSGSTNTQEELDYTLTTVRKFCTKNRLPFPSFVVVQTGTRVMETRNVGSFDSPFRIVDELPAEIQIPRMIKICNKHGIFMKEHNADYLSNEALQWHPRLGIHAANVAPEFGVSETKKLISLLEENKLYSLLERFLDLAYSSNKWQKWMISNTKASVRDKAIISGHYVFSTPECCQIKKEAKYELDKVGIILDESLKKAVKQAILRYMQNFRLLK